MKLRYLLELSQNFFQSSSFAHPIPQPHHSEHLLFRYQLELISFLSTFRSIPACKLETKSFPCFSSQVSGMNSAFGEWSMLWLMLEHRNDYLVLKLANLWISCIWIFWVEIPENSSTLINSRKFRSKFGKYWLSWILTIIFTLRSSEISWINFVYMDWFINYSSYFIDCMPRILKLVVASLFVSICMIQIGNIQW